MSDAREGRGRGNMDFKSFREGYDKIFAMCRNKECQWKNVCYRYLATPRFNQNYEEYAPIKGVCKYFSRTASKSFNQREDDNEN